MFYLLEKNSQKKRTKLAQTMFRKTSQCTKPHKVLVRDILCARGLFAQAGSILQQACAHKAAGHSHRTTKNDYAQSSAQTPRTRFPHKVCTSLCAHKAGLVRTRFFLKVKHSTTSWDKGIHDCSDSNARGKSLLPAPIVRGPSPPHP